MSVPIANKADPGPLVEPPDVSHIVIEDDEPVDGMYAEKQHRLLVEALYSSWGGPPSETGTARPFMATTNVGLFSSPREPPLVPDAMLSVDVSVQPDCMLEKRHNTYFIWEVGKPPEVVVEVVSNREGDELGKRRRGYARMRVAYYVVWDPAHMLGEQELRAFELRGEFLVSMPNACFPTLGLELAPWEGTYEGMQARWLRWHEGSDPVRTGAERAREQEERAREQEERAREQEERAARLAALLRQHGIEPGE